MLRPTFRRAVTALRTATATLFAVLVGLVVVPGRAEAHSASNAPSSNYVTTVVSLRANGTAATPTTFRLRSIEAGSRLELVWRSGDEIQIPDYDGHPYLRVGPKGVFENTQSNAVYLNRDRNGATPIPEGTNPDGPPTWRKLSSGTVVRWHDHRAHRMGGEPPEVKANPGKKQVVQQEEVTLTQGTTTWVAVVRVDWVPGPSAVPSYLVAAALALGLLAFALVSLRTATGAARLRLVVAAALLVLVAVDVLHLSGIAFGVAGTTGSAIGRMFTVGFASIAAWAIGLVAVAMLQRRRVDGYYLATFAAGLMTLVGGLADLSVLANSSVPFAFSAGVARVAVVLTLGLGVGIVVASVLATRPSVAQPAEAADEA